MADYFFSLEMLIQRAMFQAPLSILGGPSQPDLANEENQ